MESYGRDPGTDALLTAILAAGAVLTDPHLPALSLDVAHAARHGPALPALTDHECEAIVGLAAAAQSAVEAGGVWTEAAHRLPEQLTRGSALAHLVANLLPAESPLVGARPVRSALLTPTEVEVLRRASRGETAGVMAGELGCQATTVNTHLRNARGKLAATNTREAFALAVATGQIELDPIDESLRQARLHLPATAPFAEYCATVGLLRPPVEFGAADALARAGMLLLCIAGAAGRRYHSDRTAPELRRGAMVRRARAGRTEACVDAARVGRIRDLAISPSSAAGFTRGHIFAAHDLVPEHGLNRGAISEFTADGEYVRTFCGSSDVGGRLIGPLSLAFLADGRLLANAGWLTYGILCFEQGGARVDRLADGAFIGLAVDDESHVWATEALPARGCLLRLDEHGEETAVFPCAQRGAKYYSVAAGDLIYVTRSEPRGSSDALRFVDAIDRRGRVVETLPIRGRNEGTVCVAPDGTVAVACPASRTVRTWRSGATEAVEFATGPELVPYALACVGDDLWIGGAAS